MSGRAKFEVRARVIEADGRERSIIVSGQPARVLVALARAGSRGVTSLELGSWALRTSDYVFKLRRRFGLRIETLTEEHGGPVPGTHARYVLRDSVRILRDELTSDVA